MSIVKSIDYANEVLVSEDDDNYVPYLLLAVHSSFCRHSNMFASVTSILIGRAKQLKPSDSVTSFFSYCIKVFISGNILYVFYYFSPFIFLAFLHDPQAKFSTYLMIIIAIFCFCFLMVMMMSVRWAKTNRMFMLVSCSIVIITLPCIFVFMLMTIIFAVVLLLGSFNNFELLYTSSATFLTIKLCQFLDIETCLQESTKYYKNNEGIQEI